MEFSYIGNQSKKDVRLAGSFANGAFVTANSAASFANAAFDRANAAFLQANTSGGGGSSTPVTVYSDAFTANGATSTFNLSTTPSSENYIIAVVDGITQLRSTYTVTGNVVAFDTTFENGASVEVTTITGGGAVDPYASNTANAAYATANAAFLQANNSSTDTWVRTQANNAYDKANSAASFANGAFSQSNNTSSFANSAFVTANSAASFANGAFDRANAAYAAANTGGGGGGGTLTGYVDEFTANGVSNNYTLSTTPSNKNITFVAVQGVLQPKTTYSLSGNVLTFDSTLPNTAFIEITTLSGAGGSSMTWYIANANTTMVANSGYFVDTSTGPKTMTLPASATLGDIIRFNDLAGTFSANNLTVARNSHNIQGIASDLLIDIDQSKFGLVYSNTTYGWKVLELDGILITV
jgi:hypothetical protein